jgi:hypothetical protein
LTVCDFCDIENNWYAYSSAGKCKQQPTSLTNEETTITGNRNLMQAGGPLKKNFREFAQKLEEGYKN